MSSQESEKYFVASVPPVTSCLISYESWSVLQSSVDWNEVILKELNKANPYCCYSFRNKWLKKPESRKSSRIVFRCTGACSFETCPVKFKVEVYSFSDTDPNIKLEIYMLSNFVKHKKGDKKSRFV